MQSDTEVTGRPWRGLSPDQRREGRRRRLLDAGLALFGTEGYAATSLTALCAAAGVSPRHFYELHPGREQLLAELYTEIADELDLAVRRAHELAPLTVAGQVDSGLRAVTGHLAEDPRRARVALVEIVGVSPALDALRRAAVRRHAAALSGSHARLAAAGVVPDTDFDTVAVGLVGAIHELLADWLARTPRPEVDSVLPALSQLLGAVYQL